MFILVYLARSGRLMVRELADIRYEDTAVLEVKRLREKNEWRAYRLFYEDGFTTALIASWGDMVR